MPDLLKIIKERKSSRSLFDPNREISKEHLKKIFEAGTWSPTAHNMQNFEIVAITDKKILKEIGSIKFEMSDIFVRENYEQLSFSEEELKKKKTGIMGTMFPEFMRNPETFKNITPEQRRNLILGKAIETSSALLVVIYDPSKRAPASENDFLGAISLGCLMENIWLMANSLGIGVHIVSSLSAEEAEKQVKKILSIPDNLKIAFSCRLGYPLHSDTKYVRVRRDIGDFTHLNKFSNKI